MKFFCNLEPKFKKKIILIQETQIYVMPIKSHFDVKCSEVNACAL